MISAQSGATKEAPRPEGKLVLGRGATAKPPAQTPAPAMFAFAVGKMLHGYKSPETTAAGSALLGMGTSLTKTGDDLVKKTKPTTETYQFPSTTVQVTTFPSKEEKDKALKDATSSYYWGRMLEIMGGKEDPNLGTTSRPLPLSGNPAKNLALAKVHGVGDVVGGEGGPTAVRLQDGKSIRLPTGETIVGGKSNGERLATDTWISATDPRTGRPRAIGDTSADGTKYAIKFRENPKTGEREFRYEKAADERTIAHAREVAKGLEDSRREGMAKLPPGTRDAIARIREGAISETDVAAVNAAKKEQDERDAMLVRLKDKQMELSVVGEDDEEVGNAIAALESGDPKALKGAKDVLAAN